MSAFSKIVDKNLTTNPSIFEKAICTIKKVIKNPEKIKSTNITNRIVEVYPLIFFSAVTLYLLHRELKKN